MNIEQARENSEKTEDDGIHTTATGRISEFLSIVVPCLNEEITIGEFVDWCHEGIARADVAGEVIIVDSSSDSSPQIAADHGARVLSVPRRGLGQAYIDAIPEIHGEWVLMGDCDLTYDFRQIEEFIAKLQDGFQFVMGTRIKGYIEPGAMPRLHRYFGSSITTWIFNRLYGTNYSDIHSGMRAMTTAALEAMDLQSPGWEYASEMILKVRRLGLCSTEVPIRFYKDREGRESHLKRGGWTTPWKAGWDSLRVMFLNAPEYFLRIPGWICFVTGLVMSLLTIAGPTRLFGIGLNLDWMLFGIVLAAVGYSALQLTTLARVYFGFDPEKTRRTLLRLSYNRGMAIGGALVAVGLVPCVALVISWFSSGFHLSKIEFPAVFGLEAILFGCQTFAFTLLLHIIGGSGSRRRSQ